MKNSILIILLSFFTLSSFSQQYHNLIEENRSWSVLNVVPIQWGPPMDTSFNTTNYLISGDTVLNNINYKKLYFTDEKVPASYNLKGFIREDSTKKIWYKSTVDSNEVLLYDFSVAAGDSLKLGYDTNMYYTVDSIGFEILNNTTRKKYYLSHDYYNWKDIWIEGIGSNKGIIQSASAGNVGGWSRFLCMQENGNLAYMNPNYNSCYLKTNLNEIEKADFKIYPNPAKGKLIIKSVYSADIESVTLTNINGQIIKEFYYNKTKIDVSDLSSGFYILKISYNERLFTEKILIQ